MNTFSVQRRVEFCETDAAQIAHFTSIIIYMEQCEHAFLRHLGTTVVDADDGQGGSPISWPRVHVDCDYQGAARFEEMLSIGLSIARLGDKSITYQFRVSRNQELLASGSITAVCCHMEKDGIRGISIPPYLREKFKQFMTA